MNTRTLAPTPIDGEAALPQRSVVDGQVLDHADPAVLAITDFTREYPVTVDEDRQIDAALQDMIRFGVRALLVLRERRIVGLVTSYDIQGERPLQFLQNSNYAHHREIKVGHIMTSLSAVLAVEWQSVQAAKAGELLEAIRHSGLSHWLVIEKRAVGQASIIRGLVSRARLERQIRSAGVGSATRGRDEEVHRNAAQQQYGAP